MGIANPASQNTCTHTPALSEDAESFGVRPWSSTGDPARPPHPWGSGGGRNKRGQTCYRAARGQAESQLLTSQRLRQGDVVPACVTPAGQHPGEGAEMGSPTRRKGAFYPKHHPGPEVFPRLGDSSTSHVEETRGQGWIKREELSLNSLKAILGPKQNRGGRVTLPDGWAGHAETEEFRGTFCR